MRVATWNLERGARSSRAREAQHVVLRDLAADILILTEPGPSFVAGAHVVVSPALRVKAVDSESWVAIVGSTVEPVALEIPFERMATAATAVVASVPLLVYGSVLPWGFVTRAAPQVVRPGETPSEVFLRVLREQMADIVHLRKLYAEHVVIWAGDFNQTLSGPNHGGSNLKRQALSDALEELGLVAWNAAAESAHEGMRAIDLICGPRESSVKSQGRVDPTRDGVHMTDHAGYWVEF